MNNELNNNQTAETPETEVKKEKKTNGFLAFLKSRKAKRGSIATIIVAVFICIIILINYVAGLLTERFPNLQFDMTASQSYQLQKDTSEYLSKLKNDVTIYVLTRESTFKSGLGASSGSQYFIQADKLLKKMAAEDKVTLKFIDLSSNPTFTGKYTNIDWNSDNANNLIIVASGKNYTAIPLAECFEYDSESYNYDGTYN